MGSSDMLSSPSRVLSNAPLTTLCAYAAFIALSWATYDLVGGCQWTAILTLGATAHFFGRVLLCVQIFATGSVAGISAKALTLDTTALAMRLSSTLFFHGYLPSDETGDFIYQCTDLCSLGLNGYLLYSVLVRNRDTYQEDDDDMSLGPLVGICIMLGFLLHGDMNDNVIADSFWLMGLFVSVLEVLPQYWMIVKASGQLHVLTAHYIAATAAGCVLSGTFMWRSSEWITCSPLFGEFQHTVWVILLAHVVHLVLLSDFGYYYCGTVLTKSGSASVSFIPQVV